MRGRSYWAVLDQALLSGTNFAVQVLIARTLGPAEFGFFVLAYSVLLLANAIQGALITQPHNVLGATADPDQYVSYTSTTAFAQLLSASASALLLLAGAAAAAVVYSDFSPLLLATAAAAFSWQLQEFSRRVLYTEGRFGAALANDLVSYGSQALLIGGAFVSGGLSGTVALWAVSAAFAVGAGLGIWQIRSSIGPFFTPADVRRNWAFGKWLVGSAVLLFASGQAYPLLTAALVNVASTGLLRAAQTLLGPTHILLRTLQAVATPRAAQIHALHGSGALRSYLTSLYAFTCIPMGLYCAAVALLSDPLVRVLYGIEYAPYAWVVAYVAIAYFLTHLYTVLAVGLGARGDTKSIFRGYVAATGMALTVGVLLVNTLGLLGAALGTIAHAAVMSLMFWIAFAKAPTLTQRPAAVTP